MAVSFKDAENVTQQGAVKSVGGENFPKVALTVGGSDAAAVNAAAGAGAVDSGTQRMTLASDDPAVIALQIVDDWDESDRAKVNVIAGQAGISASAGAVAANTPRVTLASDDPAVAHLASVANALAAGAMSSTSITRPADTSAYAANDVIGAATGSTAAIEFTSVGVSGSAIVITCAELQIDAAAVISGETSYRLYLYGVTPPSALGDNAAFDLPSGDRASFLGFVDLGAPADLGSTLYVQALGVQKQVKLTSTSLFGYLVTLTAYTSTASRVHKVTLHTSQV